jgi:hypothetical protein
VESLPGDGAVAVLRSVFFGDDNRTCGQMSQADRGRCLVAVLPAGAGGPIRVDPDIASPDVGKVVLRVGTDEGDGNDAGMASTPFFSLGDALDAVRAD